MEAGISNLTARLTVADAVLTVADAVKLKKHKKSNQLRRRRTMSQSSSSATVELKNDLGVTCKCNRPAKILQAWTDDNTGRRFYTCQGRKIATGYDSCNFFRWYDVENPNGWQHVALVGARDVIRQQKEEIKNLRSKIMTLEADNLEEIPNGLEDELKAKCEECELLKREVLVVNERSSVYRNLLITSSLGLVIVVGIVLFKW